MAPFKNPLSRLGLRAFPPEIRQMIFRFSDALVWTGKTPALMVALRADALLYGEVTELFYRWNTFKLHGSNEWMMGDMKLDAVRSIRAVEIIFWSSLDYEDCPPNQIISPSLNTFHSHPITSASCCRTLHLNLSALPDYDLQACLEPAVTCVRKLSSLKRITVELPMINYRRADDPYDCEGCVGDLVTGLDDVCGGRGKLWTVGTKGGEVWFWEGERLGKAV